MNSMTESWNCFPYWRGECRHGTGWRLDVLKALKQKDEEALAVLQQLV